ncbi:hypothetical protein D3C83_158590 [compost metagenome]
MIADIHDGIKRGRRRRPNGQYEKGARDEIRARFGEGSGQLTENTHDWRNDAPLPDQVTRRQYVGASVKEG